MSASGRGIQRQLCLTQGAEVATMKNKVEVAANVVVIVSAVVIGSHDESRPKERVSKVFHHPHVGIVGPTQHGKVAAVGGSQGISVDTAWLLPQDARVTSHIYIQED